MHFILQGINLTPIFVLYIISGSCETSLLE
nr:MAG TPA: hypothetical protein [Caudoviricetes sp.]